ncbi:1-acyl-sn-glycerol-3-phosphate acyltransferase [Microbacterium sp. SORGH_AS428]|uniref:lysophospholipid acyltransferase family protein n=1 Tax=Microbacterium sp. SORGH_AS_0428 TaxID=3041788 RepID=UPI002864F58F|nr:lysophospholipid acyltransferase family protein [Microbacterium sp. SORGH_AS_0428]MDR6198181.1 1-acyl-sn-glycerol-3-phosphate acyltransferase [Microbacterium sp. SORGH_AS_0428]
MASETHRRRRASTEKTRPSVFWLLGGIVVPFVGLIAKIEIEGEENLPEEGPFVLAPNHHSEIDPLLVAVAVWRMGRAPRFMAKESLFRVPVLGWALRATGMIPVARASSAAAAKQSLDTARHLAERRAGVIVYPEGTLTRDPDLWPMRGKTGAARLALAGDIPLIPMAQWGAQQIMPRYGKFRLWPLRKRVRVLVGPSIALEEYRDRAAHPVAQAELTTRVMDEIAGLLSVLRGEPAPATRWEPGAHGQSETGRLE